MSTTTTAGAATSAWRHRAESTTAPLDDETLERVDAWWRAANYLSVGQIYLLNNPLLRTPLSRDDVKPRLLGHWGTTPGLNFLYAHMNRAISERELSAMYVTGPGHGGPGLVANTYLEGTYTETYPDITQDEEGMRRLFKQFSFPGGIPSHVAPETPGSIHEGGELGYALSHAYGAAFDNPDLLVFAVVGDGEAETGPLATSWHSNKFVDPAKDGVVLPVLHLNGYKIANPTVLARIPEEELADLMRGYGHKPHFFAGGFDDEDPAAFHRRFAELLDVVLDEIADIKAKAATTPEDQLERPQWPMIVFRSPKGWTGPKEIDGKRTENSWRSHQVPLANARDTDEHLQRPRDWLKSYRADELFDDAGAAPAGDRRAGAHRVPADEREPRDQRRPRAQGPAAAGLARLRRRRREPGRTDGRGHPRAGPVPRRGHPPQPGQLPHLRPGRDRLEPPAGGLRGHRQAVERRSTCPTDDDDHLARAGRVMEVLSEHQCEGWLEGYLLTGRHGLMNSYEAFIHIVDSMFNQHAKWLKVTNHIPWRRPIASLNYLLSSHVWRQDHNGFSHQDPGFIDHVVNKKADIIRVYLPPDTNTLLATYDHVLRSKQYVNVVVAGKQPAPSFLSVDEAIKHCARGLGIWDWAGTEVEGEAPDVVLGCAGDVPTLETLAAADLLRRFIPELKVRVVNVVDLMRLQDEKRAPARPERPRVRHDLHHRQAGRVRLPRLPVAHPPPHLPPPRALQHPRARLQGGGHHHHAVRHGHAQRPRPVPPGHGRHRPGARPGRQVRPAAPEDDGRPARGPHVHPRARRGHPARGRLGLARRRRDRHREGRPGRRRSTPAGTTSNAHRGTGGGRWAFGPTGPRRTSDRHRHGRLTPAPRRAHRRPGRNRQRGTSAVARSIYIASPEGYTGKSTVALGLVDLFVRRVEKVGVFRPVIRSRDERDTVVDLLLGHGGLNVGYEDAVGVTYDDVHADPDAALSRSCERFRTVERDNEVVIVVGSDYTDVAGPAELAFNARVAANLGAPVLLVVSALDRTPAEVAAVADLAVDEIAHDHATTVAVLANRCAPDQLAAVRDALGARGPAGLGAAGGAAAVRAGGARPHAGPRRPAHPRRRGAARPRGRAHARLRHEHRAHPRAAQGGHARHRRRRPPGGAHHPRHGARLRDLPLPVRHRAQRRLPALPAGDEDGRGPRPAPAGDLHRARHLRVRPDRRVHPRRRLARHPAQAGPRAGPSSSTSTPRRSCAPSTCPAARWSPR